uniref:Reverse transcriptase domain-containing protein n=1 Tax=Strongyloides venezuelensis TaxID=75913 RepID=A0A0K0EVQ2_STRVS
MRERDNDDGKDASTAKSMTIPIKQKQGAKFMKMLKQLRPKDDINSFITKFESAAAASTRELKNPVVKLILILKLKDFKIARLQSEIMHFEGLPLPAILTSLVPVLTHALTFIKLMTVKSEGEDLEEIDLPLAPVPSSRPKMKDEQNIAYSINLKKDIEKYIIDIGCIADDIDVLEGILFVDDFSSGLVPGYY